jgi:hypothetical protein
MNWDQIKKSINMRVQLRPKAAKLDSMGDELPREDLYWIITNVLEEGILIQNSGYTVILAKDHIYSFTSNPGRSGPNGPYGFLILKVQIFVQPGKKPWIEPCLRIGEPVSPQIFEPGESESQRKYRHLQKWSDRMVSWVLIRTGKEATLLGQFVNSPAGVMITRCTDIMVSLRFTNGQDKTIPLSRIDLSFDHDNKRLLIEEKPAT